MPKLTARKKMRYDFIDEGQDYDEAVDMPVIPVKHRSKFGLCPAAVLNSELSSTAKLVYTAIASFVRPGKATFPSYNRLADTVKKSRRTVIRAVQDLENAGFIKKISAIRDDGGYTSNRYTLVSPLSLSGDTDVTSPSDIDDTNPSVNIDTSKGRSFKDNKNFKNFNSPRAYTRDIAAGAQRPAQTDLEDFVPNNSDFSLLQQLKSSAGKAGAWLQLIRKDKQYYLRPASPQTFQFISEKDFAQAVDFVQKTAGSCQPLKFGQYLKKEIVINE